MASTDAEYETAPGLSIAWSYKIIIIIAPWSIGAMAFDLGWPWTVQVQGH